ncbi:MAG: ATP synthase F1 subunit epsilon [Armatimonadetes bacterium]|nr:ATP synthase F1 subunit epsilon [Armatimonadota bacterium]
MALFKLSVVAPDRTVFEDEVESVVLPGVEGYLGIQSSHEPMLVALRPGIIEYMDRNNQRSFVSVSGGFTEISDNSVIVLAQDAQRATEIDVAEAEKALEEARRALRGEASSMTAQQATEEIERAMVRIKAARLS